MKVSFKWSSVLTTHNSEHHIQTFWQFPWLLPKISSIKTCCAFALHKTCKRGPLQMLLTRQFILTLMVQPLVASEQTSKPTSLHSCVPSPSRPNWNRR
ncbi:unnamed protein product [Triticum turgidum subsp. durum]|uniref:Uncharacterized protein n=1 Tax=Triticum turgidum subsp. durum TaxID=4567 RepID=A0A9R1RR84_TRITD|nr:unnamed protein product [Triticum turgidum subsp. durum]